MEGQSCPLAWCRRGLYRPLLLGVATIQATATWDIFEHRYCGRWITREVTVCVNIALCLLVNRVRSMCLVEHVCWAPPRASQSAQSTEANRIAISWKLLVEARLQPASSSPPGKRRFANIYCPPRAQPLPYQGARSPVFFTLSLLDLRDHPSPLCPHHLEGPTPSRRHRHPLGRLPRPRGRGPSGAV